MEEKSNVKQDPDTKVDRTEDYAKLVEYGLDEKVAGKLDEIYKTGTFFVLSLQHANFLVNCCVSQKQWNVWNGCLEGCKMC